MNAHELPDHVVTCRENRSRALPFLLDFFLAISSLAQPGWHNCSFRRHPFTREQLISGALFSSRLVRLVAVDQFGKPTGVVVPRFLLVQERNVLLFELVEELLPRYLLKRLFAGIAREVDSQNSRIVAYSCALHRRGLAAAILSPFPDYFKIGSDFCICHYNLLLALN